MTRQTLAGYRLEGATHLLMLEVYLDDSGGEDLHAVTVAGGIAPKDASDLGESPTFRALMDMAPSGYIEMAATRERRVSHKDATRVTFKCEQKESAPERRRIP
jgi:hypothetical protein